jgi:hypothetical protein
LFLIEGVYYKINQPAGCSAKEFSQLFLEAKAMSATPKEPAIKGQLVTNHLAKATTPHHCLGLLEKVEKLRGHSANWDGYGAGSFTNEMLEAVKTFLASLPDNLLASPAGNGDHLGPAIVPMSSGAIQLEWHVENRILELEFENPSTIHYLKWWPKESIEEEESYSVDDSSRSVRLIQWVLGGYDPE